MESILLHLAAFAYLIAAVALGLHVLRSGARSAAVGTSALAGGFLVQSAWIALQLFRLGFPPMTTFNEGLAFLAWLIVGSCLVVSRSSKLTVIGAVVSPLACALTLTAATVYGNAVAPAVQPSAWLRVHITLAFLAAAVFSIAAWPKVSLSHSSASKSKTTLASTSIQLSLMRTVFSVCVPAP